MRLLYKDRPESETNFIKDVCNYILSQPIGNKEYSEDFAFIFVDGRKDTNFETLEHKAMFHSCKVFSKKKYPIFCFVNNVYGLKNMAIDELTVIPIEEINNLESYSKFCINELYFKLPKNIENIITIQGDGFLLRNGFEDWLINNDFSIIGAHWQHQTGLKAIDGNGEGWAFKFPPVNRCNLGFSFRRASKIREIANTFSKYKLEQWTDNNCPEDAFFSYFGYGTGLCKLPTLKECDIFCKDALTLDIWNNKENLPFGFHYFKTISEFPPCNHN